MKIGVIADIHANFPALVAVLDELDKEGCDRVYHVGDLVGIGSFPSECVHLVREKGINNIMGNHDELVAKGMPSETTLLIDDDEYMHQHWTHSRLNREDREYIRSFPYEISEEIYGVKVLFTHFSRSEKEFLDFDPKGDDQSICSVFGNLGMDLVCFGHIHRRIRTRVGKTHFYNPSSLGCSPLPVANYGIISINKENYEIFEGSVSYSDNEFLERYLALEIPATEEINRYFLGGRILKG